MDTVAASLQGKNMLVTGSRRGIGRAIVKKAAGLGMNVWAHARKYDREFEEDMERIAEENHVWIRPIYFDLSREEEIKAGITKIRKEERAVYLLVNNGAVNISGSFLMTPVQRFRETYQVNVFAPLLLMQYCARMMIAEGSGVIINVISASSKEYREGTASYASSKAALQWLTKGISRELAPYHIRVNGISPGLTETSMTEGYEEETDRILSRMNVKRKAQPEEIAEGVFYLASPLSSFVSGHILEIDGGRL